MSYPRILTILMAAKRVLKRATTIAKQDLVKGCGRLQATSKKQ